MKHLVAALFVVGVLMATFSMFGTRTRVMVSGDETGCREYLGEANKMLYQLRVLTRGKANSIYAMPPWKYSDGTVITAWTCDGRDNVAIHKPVVGSKTKKITTTDYMVITSGVGMSNSLSTWDISKYSQAEDVKWTSSNNYDGMYYYSWKVDVNENGEIYSIGGYYDEEYTVSDSWAIKRTDLKGEQKWLVGDNSGYITDVASDNTGVYVTGRKYSPVSVQVQKRSREDGSINGGWSIAYTKPGATSAYYTPLSIEIDSEYVYVSFVLFNYTTSKYQGHVLTLDKDDGSVVELFADAEYPVTLYKTPYDIAIAVKDRSKNDLSNVFILSENWLKTLSGDTIATHEYGYVTWDNDTRDIGIDADDTGIYIVCQRYTATLLKDGYDVKKYDYSKKLVWETHYNDNADTYDGAGPFLSDLAVGDKYVYVSGHMALMTAPYTITRYKLLQCLDKNTGEIKWTNIDDTGQTFWWGVATTSVTTSVEVKE